MDSFNISEFNAKGFIKIKSNIIFHSKIKELTQDLDELIPRYNDPFIPKNAKIYGRAISQRLDYQIPDKLKHPNILFGKRLVIQAHNFPKKILNLIEDPYVLEIAKKALNTDRVVFHNGSLSAVYPGNTGNGSMYHSDTSNFYDPKKTLSLLGTEKKIVNLMILFNDTCEQLAPMKILEGTHNLDLHKKINSHVAKKLNKNENTSVLTQKYWIYEELLEDFNLNEITFTGSTGDIGVMNSFVLHKASENLTFNKSRVVLILNFGRKKDNFFLRQYPYVDSKKFYNQFNNKEILDLSYKKSSQIFYRLLWKFEDILLRINKFISIQFKRLLSPSVSINKLYFLLYNLIFLIRVQKREYLNLGSGLSFKHPQFITLDVRPEVKTNAIEGIYNFDLTKDLPLPCESDSIRGIYSSHCFEHLTRKQVKDLLSECFRVLKKNGGGVLRIIVPNMGDLFKNYDSRNISYFSWLMDKQNNQGQLWVFDSWIRLVTRSFAGHMVDLFSDKDLKEMYSKNNLDEYVNKILLNENFFIERWVPNSHKSFWTEISLKKELESNGFKNIKLSTPSNSREKVFRNRWFFDNTLPEKSIIMEAVT